MEKMRGFERKKARSLREPNDTEEIGIVRRLEKNIAILASELREEIDRGEYELVVGDDASGRIPALMMATLIRDVYASKGFRAPMLRNLTGSRPDKEEVLDSIMRQSAIQRAADAIHATFEKSGRTGKALLVTDTIDSGLTADSIVTALKESGFGVDVATVSLLASDDQEHPEERAKVFAKEWGAKVVSSEYNLHGVFRHPMSGVKKTKQGAYATEGFSSREYVRMLRAAAIASAHAAAKQHMRNE